MDVVDVGGLGEGGAAPESGVHGCAGYAGFARVGVESGRVQRTLCATALRHNKALMSKIPR